MKIIAYTIVHYGREWLHWAIASVIKQVDEMHIFYTPVPSHGHGTNKVCPETMQMVHDSIKGDISNKVYWHVAHGFRHEGEQRHYAVDECVKRGADTVLVVDADELWDEDVLGRALEFVEKDRSRATSYRIGMRHFWRSVYWVNDDQAMPTRIIKPLHIGYEIIGYLGPNVGKVFHMGYAQSPNIVEYKQHIHGHKGEWRQGWFTNKFMGWSPKNLISDVHPTNVDYWTPKPIDGDIVRLDRICGDHPYWKTEVIEDGSF